MSVVARPVWKLTPSQKTEDDYSEALNEKKKKKKKQLKCMCSMQLKVMCKSLICERAVQVFILVLLTKAQAYPQVLTQFASIFFSAYISILQC